MTSPALYAGLSAILPAIPLALSIFLLRRALRSDKQHWLALGASAMGQMMSSLWLIQAARNLPLWWETSAEAVKWQHVTLQAGPFFCVSLTVLTGGFLLGMRYQDWKLARKAVKQASPAKLARKASRK